MNNELRDALSLIITDANRVDLLVQHANEIGRQLVGYPKKEDRLSTSQIRSLFGEVRQIEAQWSMGGDNRKKAYRRMVLLKPKMAYRAKKERKQGVQDLVEILDSALGPVIRETDETRRYVYFSHFVEFFEAILAYHKAAGGN